MGFISKLSGTKSIEDTPNNRVTPKRTSRLWREAFGQVDKDAVLAQRQIGNEGGSITASTISSAAATARLVQALRSQAPGGWSDNRWAQTNHFVGAVYVAIDRIATMLQQSEFAVYKKDDSHPDGKRPVTKADKPEGSRFCKPYDLVELLEKPNKQDSFGKMLYRISQQKGLTGSALNWMVPNKLGVPMELYVIPTAIMIPQTVVSPEYPEGFYRCQPVYPYGPFSSYPTPNSAVGAPIPAEWVLKFQNPHPLLRYEGYSPLTALNQQIDQLEQMDRSRWYSMYRSVNPSAVLNFAGTENMQPIPQAEIDRIHAEWQNEFQGTPNHGKLIVGTPGGELEQWGNRPIDMDYPEGWSQVLSFIMGGGFGITKPAAGMVEDSSYAQLYATLKQLFMTRLEPDCDDMASTFTRNLAPFFGDDLIVEIRCKRIDDPEVNKIKFDAMLQGKFATKNEARKMWDMPVTSEEWGEELLGAEEQQMAEMEMENQKEMQAKEQEAAVNGEQLPMPGQKPAAVGAEQKEEKEVTKSRPSPGHVSKGSLGPRMKGLEIGYQKSLGDLRGIKQILERLERKTLANHVENKRLHLNGHSNNGKVK